MMPSPGNTNGDGFGPQDSHARNVWDRLLDEIRGAHSHPVLGGFCSFPTDIVAQNVRAFHVPAADLLLTETGLCSESYAGFCDAVVAGARLARWRETYKHTGIGDDFLTRFGCYEAIGGPDAPFASQTMRSFIVYMPPWLHYPWHHHPAEEVYLVIAGEAEFMLARHEPRILRPGECALHPSMQPHATATREHPLLAYVVWRGDLDVAPVLTECNP